MRIYLAGRITGLDPFICGDLFRRADGAVEGRGHEALNPLKLVCQKDGRCYEEYLHDALRIVLHDADAVLMLANWRDSRGAKIERFIAQELGRRIYYKVIEIPVI